MANIQNLKHYGKDKAPLTHEQAVRIGRKGGIKSAEIKKERKTFADFICDELAKEIEITLKDKKIKITKKELLSNSLVNKVIQLVRSDTTNNIDIRTLEFLRDTIGEKPTDQSKVEVKGNVQFSIIRANNADKTE